VAEVKDKPELPKVKQKKTRQIRLTPDNIDRFQQRLYFENLPALLDASYKQLLKKTKAGDVKALDMCLQIVNLFKPRNGQVNVITQVYNKNGESPTADKAQSFESILRRLEAGDGTPQQGPSGQKARSAVIDV